MSFPCGDKPIPIRPSQRLYTAVFNMSSMSAV